MSRKKIKERLMVQGEQIRGLQIEINKLKEWKKEEDEWLHDQKINARWYDRAYRRFEVLTTNGLIEMKVPEKMYSSIVEEIHKLQWYEACG